MYKYGMLGFAMIFVVSCASGWNTKQHTRVAKLAAFDLSCPETDITTTELDKSGSHISRIGVLGCGKKATYVHVQGGGTGDKWVMNVVSGDENAEAGNRE